MELSIIILTDRHDAIFEQCLASCQFASEIIIVDNQSANDWLKLAKKYHFRLLKWPDKINNFSQVKNWACSLALHHWVFFVDSDEIIDQSAKQIIKQIIKDDNYGLVTVRREDYFLGRKINFGEVGNCRFIRLAKKELAKWHRPVHEHLAQKVVPYQSAIVLKHYAHQGVSDFLASVSYYAYLEAKYRFNHKLVSKQQVYLEMIFYPVAKFIGNYFFKLGLLDGYRGLIYASLMSFHSLLVRIFLHELIYEKTDN